MDWYFIANSVTLISVFVTVFFLGRAYEIIHQLKRDTKAWSKK